MIEIRKATITSGIFLAYEYNIQENNVSNKNNTQSTAPIHDDLRNAFKKLIPHFILLTEEMPEDKMKGIIENNLQLPEDIENKYQVSSFALGGSEDNQTIIISGHKVLSNDRIVSFSSPSQKIYDSNIEGYKFTDELREALEYLISEVQEYMDGKQAPKTNVGTFDFPDDDETEAFKLPSDEELGEKIGEKLAEGFDGTVTVTANGKSKTFGKKRQREKRQREKRQSEKNKKEKRQREKRQSEKNNKEKRQLAGCGYRLVLRQ